MVYCPLSLLVALVITVARIDAQSVQYIPTISNGADVIFVLDGSARVTSKDWSYLQNWLRQLTEYWQLGPSGVHVGFYTYGNGGHMQYTLQQGTNFQQVASNIQKMQLYGGAANAGEAMLMAYRDGFTAQNGGRQGVPRIIVSVGAGPAADPALYKQEVQAAKQQGIAVYNVGIGPGGTLSTSDMASMASEPSTRYVYTSQNFGTLPSITESLATRIADELPASGSLPAPTEGCLQRADVAFLLDGSSSVGETHFQRLLNYVKTFSSQLPVSESGVHVGVMQFSSLPSTEFGLSVYTSRESLLKAIDNIHYQGGGTNTAAALEAARTQMFSQGMGARAQVPRVAVVVTDGQSSSMAETVHQADEARKAGISVVAVGVGSSVNTAELRGIADNPQDVFTITDYDQLATLSASILQQACKATATVPPLSATLSPSVQDPCQDKISNCVAYSADACTSYAAWAKENCARHCKFCQALVPDVLPACVNKLSNCGEYDISVCSDPQFKPWATGNCALYCGLCGSDTSSNGYYGQCFYKGKTYATGEMWYDGCDYQCTCENGQTGQYRCYNRCPLYQNLPAQCTLVRTPGECCLQPVCNFNPSITTSVTSGRGTTASGMSVCEYLGHQYVQGESWDVGCSLKCTCQDSKTGQIRCQDYCPRYGPLPTNCYLQQKMGQCCSEPVCEFTTQVGSITGRGMTSGVGAVAHPTDPLPCVDVLANCPQYTTAACKDPYIPWARDNCRAFCNLCTTGRAVPTPKDNCTYDGKAYKQDDTWLIGCDQQCVCEDAVYGYYRCYNKCPQYTNVPAECTRTPAGDGCCETITCPATSVLSPSTTNILSLGSGNGILQPNPLSPNGQLIQVVPTLPAGGTVGLNTQVSGYQVPPINGCLFNGKVYVQGQRWDDGCIQVCECTSASQGLYTCSSRCPTYQNLPVGCTLQTDPADSCCRVPSCQPGVQYVAVPVYTTGSVSSGQVRPPSLSELVPTTSTLTFTQQFSQGGGNTPPAMPTGPVPTGGIGYCVYKNQTYRQSERWVDGCDYNCLCEDASTGFWRCADMCLKYPPMNQYCQLVSDPESPCCKKPYCVIPGWLDSIMGTGSTQSNVVTTIPSFTLTSTGSPKPAMCVYKGAEYSQGQQWFDGCDFKCVCYEAQSNMYSCSQRCSTYYGIDTSRCTMKADPTDPKCCTIPVCTPLTQAPPTGPTPVPSVPGGSFEAANSQVVGYCDYKGAHYGQDQVWQDGCDYKCECLDASKGQYRCNEICPRFPELPSECRLVPDFADPCCKKPTCNFLGSAGGINGQVNVLTPVPNLTTAPGGKTPVCVYNDGNYYQGQTWDVDCDRSCRCEDAAQGIYVCNDRCAKYPALTSSCVLVTDPKDQCCKIPQCSFTPVSGQQTGHSPTPFPTTIPGQIQGQANVANIGYCVYNGVRYGQGEMWTDGCDYNCTCQDYHVGKYVCDEICPKFPSLPAECRLLRDPAKPCCNKPDCSFNPLSGSITGAGATITPIPVLTVAPPFGSGTVTLFPSLGTTPSPLPVCVYRNVAYGQGQTWYDGCNYKCICENAVQGVYRCNDRCPSYPAPAGVKCTMKADPNDPMCCLIPECETASPTPISPNGLYIVPTVAPQGVITGGSVNPTPRPSVSADGSTAQPPLGSTQTPAPTNVCVYKGLQYRQDQKWQDGCDYNCECVDAPNGQYRCTEMCPRYPPIPSGCYMVRDVYNPCCQTPVCPFPPTQPPTQTPESVATPVPATAPGGQTLRPPTLNTPVPKNVCVYNGVPYSQGQTWNDGCDLRCRCENSNLNIYRCDQRCARYDLQVGCTMVTDPRDSCCLVPSCQPVLPATLSPNANPGVQPTSSPTGVPVPTAIPGVVVGNSVGKPNNNNLANENMCVYNGKVYKTGDTWIDGCDYMCRCADQTTGLYQCHQRCAPYINVPSYCTMVVDPADACCKRPVCTNPGTLSPPLGGTVTPYPNPFSTPGPILLTTPSPVTTGVCTYKNAVYVEGQQWYDDCAKVCVCEDGKTGFYRCSDRCKTYDMLPDGCTLVVDPKDPACCKVPQCAPTPGPNGYLTPLPGQSVTPFVVTNVPGVVTGRLPTPTQGPSGETPQPNNACVYKGRMYARGQRWQDGCDYNCVCQNEVTGEYECTERCNAYPLIPPQCHLQADPKDYCCEIMVCDLSLSTPNPYLTPAPSTNPTGVPILIPPTAAPNPNESSNSTQTPKPIPGTASPTHNPPVTVGPGQVPTFAPQPFCVYHGVAYRQGETWDDGCSKRCRCDDASRSIYTCFDRCPTYNNVDPSCRLTLDPNDACCQVPVCAAVLTLSPTLNPSQTPAFSLTPAPTPTPFAVPQRIPGGSISGNNPNTNPEGKSALCVYKGVTYTQGQTWEDGCDYNCVCVDEKTGRWDCKEKCDTYVNVPPYCVLVKDPNDKCCMTSQCVPPVTQSPTYSPGQPTPGVTAQPPLGTPTPTPSPGNVCIMNGRSYTQGQQWYDGCKQICVCENSATGFYRCTQRCPDYPNSDPTCLVVPDPADPVCCTVPQCPSPQNPNIPEPVKGTFTGNGNTPIPTPSPVTGQIPSAGQTFAPGQTYPPGYTFRPGDTPPPGMTPAPDQIFTPAPTFPPGYTFPTAVTPGPGQTPGFGLTYPPGYTFPPGGTPPLGMTPALGQTYPPGYTFPTAATPGPGMTPTPGQTYPPGYTFPPGGTPPPGMTPGPTFPPGYTFPTAATPAPGQTPGPDQTYPPGYTFPPGGTPAPGMTPAPGKTYPPGYTFPTAATPAPDQTPAPGLTYPPGYTFRPGDTPPPGMTPAPGMYVPTPARTYAPGYTFPTAATPGPNQTPVPGLTYPPGYTFPPGGTPPPGMTPAPSQTYPPGYTFPAAATPPKGFTYAPGQTYPPGYTFAPGDTPPPGLTPGPTFPPGYTFPTAATPGLGQTPAPDQTYPPGYTFPPGGTPPPGMTPEPGKTYPPGYTFPTAATPAPGQTPQPGETYPPGFTLPPGETAAPILTFPPGYTLPPGVTPGPDMTPPPWMVFTPAPTFPPNYTFPTAATPAPGMTPAQGQTYPPGYTFPPGGTPPPGMTPAIGQTYPPGYTFPTAASPAPGQTYAPGLTYPPGYTFQPGATPPLGMTPAPGMFPTPARTYPPGYTFPTAATPAPGQTAGPGLTYPPGYTFPPGGTPPPGMTPAPSQTYPPGYTFPTAATPAPDQTFAPSLIYPPGYTFRPGDTPPPGMTPAPDVIFTPGPTFPPGYTFPTAASPAPGQTPEPGLTYPPGYTFPPGGTPPPGMTPAPNQTYPPRYTFPTAATPAPDQTFAPGLIYPPGYTFRPGDTPPPGMTPAPGMIIPTPGRTYPPGYTFPTAATPGPNQTPAPGLTYPPGYTFQPGDTPPPGMTPAPGKTYPPGYTFPTAATPGPSQTIAPGITYPPYYTFPPGGTPPPGMTPGPNEVIPTPNTYPPGYTFAPGVTPPKDMTPPPGLFVTPAPTFPPNYTFPTAATPAPGMTPAHGQTYPPGYTFPPGGTPPPGMTPAIGQTYPPGYTFPTAASPAPGQTYAPGLTYPPGYTFQPGATPSLGMTPAPGMFPTPGPTYPPGYTFAPGVTPPPGLTPAQGQTYPPGYTMPSGVTPPPGYTPQPGETFTPQPGVTQAPKQELCVYKGVSYKEGQRWRDGCDYDCVCIDAKSGQYRCTDRCGKFPALVTSGCSMQRDPNDPCCQIPVCSSTVSPTLVPGPTLKPGDNPTIFPNQVPTSAVCVYQGVPYIQGQAWNDGCDKKCRCENAMTRTVSCDDRCAKYPNMQANCRMVTDPQDACCQVPVCSNPNTGDPTKVITGLPGTISGSNLPPQPPNPLVQRINVCVYRGVEYNQGVTWYDGCSYTCVCDDAVNGHYTCTERCARLASLPSTCTLVQDPKDLCCQIANCPVNNPLIVAPTGQSTPAQQPGQTPTPSLFITPVPSPVAGLCLFKNQYYREKQVWYDDCNAICTCEDGNTGFYRCQSRCGDYAKVDPSCIMVPDPKDPTCCQIPECPLIPAGGTTPGVPTIIRPTQPTAVFTNLPTPSPRPEVTPALGPDGNTLSPQPASTLAPALRTGCYYKGRVYHGNERWDDGCEFQCACLDDMSGQYECNERCPRVPSLPSGCVFIPDPQDTCCEVPYCDFGPHPFTNGIPTPNPNQTPTTQTTVGVFVPGFVTNSQGGARTTLNPNSNFGGTADVCVYKGVIYRAGQTWNDGCSQTCVCDDAVHGLYSCKDRCPSFSQLDATCVLRTNPADPCCLVPDCNPNYVTPAPGTGFTGNNPLTLHPVTGPGVTGIRPDIILAPTAAPATFTGTRPYINSNNPSMTGYSTMCVYKGALYAQGAKWEDECQYKCECVDATRGLYRCTERCSSYYFLPKGCTYEQDPKDTCCKVARCHIADFPTPTPLATLLPTMVPVSTPKIVSPGETTPIIVTGQPGPVYQGTLSPIGATVQSFTGKPFGMCVYKTGATYRQGERWSDGCAYNCLCVDANTNDYKCDFRCTVYSELPNYCHLVSDPLDACCEKVYCEPQLGNNLVPMAGDNQPTASPTLSPSITNVVPLGTHTIISGSSLPTGETRPAFFGGMQVCVYKGTTHQPAESWDDGCDYTCTCLVDMPGVYQCTSKCPKYPPLPRYCNLVDIPGQCCPSMHCNIPDAGAYTPVPQTEPHLIPTIAPGVVPSQNPQMVLSGLVPMMGVSNLPGNGYILSNPSTIGGISDRCVYLGTDGKYRVYKQGEIWTINTCDYTCECLDARTGYYQCKPMCPDYAQGSLPSVCSVANVAGQCCPSLRCTNPDGTVTDPTKNPGNTHVPVYGLIGTGYSGFRPGYIPGRTNIMGGTSNVCIYEGKIYSQGMKWDDGCNYSCDCTDSSTGMYTCRSKCARYTTLPPVCHLVNVAGDCCPKVKCEALPITPTPNATSPSPTPQCVDKLTNCAQYDKSTACVGQYEPWAKDNCRVTCGFCTPETTPAGPCVDKLDNCAAYGESACTGQYVPWATDNCAKFCNLCPCTDVLPNCNQYGSFACIGQYAAWAQNNCRKTCGYCPGGTHTTPLPTSTGIVPEGWTLLLKGVSGAPGDLWQLWESPNTANTERPAALRLTSEYLGHYKPDITNHLDSCDFDKMMVAVYRNGIQVANIVFDGRNTGHDDWFTPSRIISSTYNDLTSQSIAHFQLTGDPASGREFYIGGTSTGCTGSGWIMVSTRSTCSYETGSKPGFYYSAGTNAASWDSSQLHSGDVFAIMGQGGTCEQPVNPTFFVTRPDVCVYNNNIYKQGEWWLDGCNYNCTCEDGQRGFYRCVQLCTTYTNLPSTCQLVKQPDECCAKPVGAGCPGGTGACIYKDNFYQQGQQWNDGCDYKCTCVDALSGRYQCTSRCLAFQLPDACHMDPAPAGKCCPVPVCTPPYTIELPPGYDT